MDIDYKIQAEINLIKDDEKKPEKNKPVVNPMLFGTNQVLLVELKTKENINCVYKHPNFTSKLSTKQANIVYFIHEKIAYKRQIVTKDNLPLLQGFHAYVDFYNKLKKIQQSSGVQSGGDFENNVRAFQKKMDESESNSLEPKWGSEEYYTLMAELFPDYEETIAKEKDFDFHINEAKRQKKIDDEKDKLRKLSPYQVAIKKGFDWQEVGKIFQSNGKPIVNEFIKEKMIEGWKPEDGMPVIPVSFIEEWPTITAWTFTLAVKKALELGYVFDRPGELDKFYWNRAYLPKNKQVNHPHRLYELRTYKSATEIDYEKAIDLGYEHTVYDFGGDFKTFKNYVTHVEKQKKLEIEEVLKRFKKSDKPCGIVKRNPIAKDRTYTYVDANKKKHKINIKKREGGIYAFNMPYNSEKTVIGRIPFNTKVDILERNDTDKWFKVSLKTEKGNQICYVTQFNLEDTFPYMDYDAKYYLIKPGDTKLEVVMKYYNANYNLATDFIPMINIFNGSANFKLKEHHLMWMPSKLRLLSALATKDSDNVNFDEDRLEDLLKNEYKIKKLNIDVAKHAREFRDNREIVDEIPTKYIDEFNDLNGFTWTDFLMYAAGGMTMGLSIGANKLMTMKATKDLEAKLRKLGKDIKGSPQVSISNIMMALGEFQNKALKFAYDMLNQSEEIAHSEYYRYKKESEFKKLLKVLRNHFSPLYTDGDLKRAKAAKRFFSTERDTYEPYWKVWTEGDHPDDGWWDYTSPWRDTFIELQNAAKGSEEDLAKFLRDKHSRHVERHIAAYNYIVGSNKSMRSYERDRYRAYESPLASINFEDTKWQRSQYPEFYEADKSDEERHKLKAKDYSKEFPIIADPSINWRDVIRVNEKNDPDGYGIRSRLIGAGGYITNKFKHIETVKTRLREDPTEVWKFKPIIAQTLANEGVAEGTPFHHLIKGHIANLERLDLMESIVLGAIGIALVIAGFFTGGSTWALVGLAAGGVAVSAVDLYREVRKYELMNAGYNSGIGEIMAMTNEKPSTLGIALAVLGLAFDVGDVIKALSKALKVIKVGADMATQLPKEFRNVARALENAGKLPKGVSVEEFALKLEKMYEAEKHLDTFATDAMKYIKSKGYSDLGEVAAGGGREKAFLGRLFKSNKTQAKIVVDNLAKFPGALQDLAVKSLVQPKLADAIITSQKAFKSAAKSQRFVRQVMLMSVEEASDLPAIVAKIGQKNIAKNPDLAYRVLTTRGLKNIFANSSDPAKTWTKLEGLWEEFIIGRSIVTGSGFRKYIKGTKGLSTVVDINKYIIKSVDEIKRLQLQDIIDNPHLYDVGAPQVVRKTIGLDALDTAAQIADKIKHFDPKEFEYINRIRNLDVMRGEITKQLKLAKGEFRQVVLRSMGQFNMNPFADLAFVRSLGKVMFLELRRTALNFPQLWAKIQKEVPGILEVLGKTKTSNVSREYMDQLRRVFADQARKAEFARELVKKRQRILKAIEENFGKFDYEGFNPQGMKLDELEDAFIDKLIKAYHPDVQPMAREFLEELIESGSTMPKVINVVPGGPNATLYKILPIGEKVKPFSPYWFTKAELETIISKGSKMEDYLGLPLGSFSDVYKVVKITTDKPQTVFSSTVAPTVQRGFKTTGGAEQTLVPNRALWTEPVVVKDEYIPGLKEGLERIDKARKAEDTIEAVVEDVTKPLQELADQSLKKIKPKGLLRRKLKDLSETVQARFNYNYKTAGDSFRKLFDEDPSWLKEYELLVKFPLLRKNPEVLRAVREFMTNPKYKKFVLNKQMLSILSTLNNPKFTKDLIDLIKAGNLTKKALFNLAAKMRKGHIFAEDIKFLKEVFGTLSQSSQRTIINAIQGRGKDLNRLLNKARNVIVDSGKPLTDSKAWGEALRAIERAKAAIRKGQAIFRTKGFEEFAKYFRTLSPAEQKLFAMHHILEHNMFVPGAEFAQFFKDIGLKANDVINSLPLPIKKLVEVEGDVADDLLKYFEKAANHDGSHILKYQEDLADKIRVVFADFEEEIISASAAKFKITEIIKETKDGLIDGSIQLNK